MNVRESIESEKDKVKLEPVMPEDLPVRRKRTADMAGSYDWTSQLIEPGFCAAPVSCFKHVSSSVSRNFCQLVYVFLVLYRKLLLLSGSYIRDLG